MLAQLNTTQPEFLGWVVVSLAAILTAVASAKTIFFPIKAKSEEYVTKSELLAVSMKLDACVTKDHMDAAFTSIKREVEQLETYTRANMHELRNIMARETLAIEELHRELQREIDNSRGRIETRMEKTAIEVAKISVLLSQCFPFLTRQEMSHQERKEEET